MKFMVIVKASPESEAGKMPSTELLAAMGKYNEELVKAGVMQDGAGLHPSSRGARVRFAGEKRNVTDGPFAETKELIAGYWLWECASLTNAIDWLKKCPNPMESDSEIESRPFAGMIDMAGILGSAAGPTPAGQKKFMVIVKATPASEADDPQPEMRAAMGRYNALLIKAGVVQEGGGLLPSSAGARVRFAGKGRSVIDGPFTESKELVAGYWVWNCASLGDAVEWLKKCPNPMPVDSDIEIRQVFTAEDFGAALTPELREQENRTRAMAEHNKKA